MKLIKSIQIFY